MPGYALGTYAAVWHRTRGIRDFVRESSSTGACPRKRPGKTIVRKRLKFRAFYRSRILPQDSLETSTGRERLDEEVKEKKKRRNEETKRRTGGARGGAVCEYGREKGRINPYSRYYTYTYIVSERVLRVYQNRRSFDFFHAVYFLTA